MQKIKTTLFTSLIIFSFLNSNAQNGLKEPVTFKLKNGMTIIVSENNRSTKAFSSFTLDNKSFQHKKDGSLELLNTILNESVQKDGQISFNDNSGKLSASVTDFDTQLTAFATAIIHAKIDQKTFNMAKAKLITSLKLQDYDYDQTVNEDSINALSLADIEDFYNEITPDKTYLTIAGDVNLNDAKGSAKKAFGNWNKEESTSLTLPISK